jgi:DNA (cytosine-5)-methyltransferase 1
MAVGRRSASAVGRVDKTPPAIDLFAGAGGMTVGLKRAGFRVAGAVEIDPLAAETYRANHADVHLWEVDIRELAADTILDQFKIKRGELGLVAGCPPCQGFSSITTLNGNREVEDNRNDLVFEYGRLVRELLPRAILMENVPGLASDRRMTTLCDMLEDLGYPVRRSLDVLNAADYGVPQRRRRLVMLAVKDADVAFAPANTEFFTVKTAFEGLPPAGNSGDVLHDVKEKRSDDVMTRIRATPKDGGSRADLGPDAQLPCHKKLVDKKADGFKDIYGRMSWGKPAPTITGGCASPSKGRFLHPDEDRAITLREAAVLQGFDPDYFFSLKRGKFAAAAMIGNALPPAFVEAHARQLAERLQALSSAAAP